ncbi:MAG: MerC domain-containing protein [Chitinophagaceae bacterium]
MLPLLLSSLPLFGINIINNQGFEFFMIFLAFGIGIYSLWHGYKKHHQKILPVILFTLGILLLFIKQFFHQHFLILLIPAVILIVSAHIINFRACSKAGCQTH